MLSRMFSPPTDLADFVEGCLDSGETRAQVFLEFTERGVVFGQYQEGYRLSVECSRNLFGISGRRRFVVDDFIPEDHVPGYGGVTSNCVCVAITAVRTANLTRDYLIRKGMLSPLVVMRG